MDVVQCTPLTGLDNEYGVTAVDGKGPGGGSRTQQF